VWKAAIIAVSLLVVASIAETIISGNEISEQNFTSSSTHVAALEAQNTSTSDQGGLEFDSLVESSEYEQAVAQVSNILPGIVPLLDDLNGLTEPVNLPNQEISRIGQYKDVEELPSKFQPLDAEIISIGERLDANALSN
jgi:hypothetical protein